MYLTIPTLSSFMGVGALWDNLIINDDAYTNTLSPNTKKRNLLYYLKYLLVESLTVFQQCEELLMKEGSDEVMDGRRIILILNLLIIGLSPVIPICISVAENLPLILESMTCQILGVRAIAGTIITTHYYYYQHNCCLY